MKKVDNMPPNKQDFIPPGLEYKQEYWDKSLVQIKRHERLMFWKRFSVVCVLTMLVITTSWLAWNGSKDKRVAHMAKVEFEHVQIQRSVDTYNNRTQKPVHIGTPAKVSATIAKGENPAPKEIQTQNDIDSNNDSSFESNLKLKEENSKPGSEKGTSVVYRVDTDWSFHKTIEIPTNDTSLEKIGSWDQAINEDNKEEGVTPENPFGTLKGEKSNSESNANKPLNDSFKLQGAAVQNTIDEITVVLDSPTLDYSNKTIQQLLAESSIALERGLPITMVSLAHGVLPTYYPTSLAPLGTRLASLENKYRLILPQDTWNAQVYAGNSMASSFSSRISELLFNPFVGANIDYNHSKKLSFRGGLEYFVIQGVNRSYRSAQVEYDFIYRADVTTYSTKSLSYVDPNLHVAWRVAQRSQFFAGGGLSYLISGRNEVQKSVETSIENTILSTGNDKNYINGFETLNPHIDLGYNFYLTKKTAIGVNYQCGLGDISINDAFENEEFDRNSRLTSFIKYTFGRW